MAFLKLFPLVLALLLQKAVVVAHQNSTHYDYIVVGAGSAGSIVAGELAKDGSSVLVLEAGGDDSDPAIHDMTNYFDVAFNPFNYGYAQWGYETVNQTVYGASAATKFNLPRGKVVGGCASINAAAFVTGHRDDYDIIAQDLGDLSWGWKNIKRYIRKLRKKIGVVQYDRYNQVGGDAYADAAEDVLGFQYNTLCGRGKQNGICPSDWNGYESPYGGVRSTANDVFLKVEAVKPTGNANIYTQHRVNKLLFDPVQTTKVVGVEAYHERSFTTTSFFASKEVILSAGVYNSPQLLLLSGIGAAQDLTALGIPIVRDLPGVGQNLRDHFNVATFWTQESLLPEDAPFLFQSPVLNLFGPEQTGQTKYQFEISGAYGTVVPLRPTSVGSVTLQSTNPEDKPLIDPKAVSTQADFDALVWGLKDFLLPFFDELITKGYVSVGSLSPTATLAEIESYVRQSITSSHHPVGTCKVGNAYDSTAVVDEDFKVYGVDNLRVVDASVFPVVPSGNTNGPTMAIALLAVDKILGTVTRRNLRGDDLGDDEEK